MKENTAQEGQDQAAPSVPGPELVCIGNAMVDVFARVDENIDRLLPRDTSARHVDHQQLAEILVTLPDPVSCSGGGAANVSKIAALLGIPTAFIGTTGSRPHGGPDAMAELFETELRSAGVSPVLSQGKSPTGICLVLRSGEGESIILASPSAALELKPADIPEELIRRAKVLVLDGYMLGRRELVLHILKLADQWGTAVALDIGSEGIARSRGKEIIRYTRDYPLILFMNEDEAKALYGAVMKGTGEEVQKSTGLEDFDRQTKRMFSYFQQLTADDIFPIIAVKRGAKGAVTFAGGTIYPSETPAVIPLESTGAGDTFCAAFLAGWIRNRSIPECATLGNRAARIILDVPGTKVDPKKLHSLARSLR